MSDIVIPKGDYVEIVKPICINPFGDYFINIKRGSRLRLSKDLKIGDKYAICILTSYEKYMVATCAFNSSTVPLKGRKRLEQL